LKIRDPTQHPVAILTILQDDPLAQSQSPFDFSQLSQFMSMTDNIHKKVKKDEVKVPKVERKVEEIPMSQSMNFDMSKMQITLMQATFIQDMHTVPETIYPEAKDIYKTISIKNTGNTVFPKNAFIEPVGQIGGIKTPLPQVETDKAFTALLIVKSPGKIGNYSSQWRVAYVDQNGQTQAMCEPFSLNFTIVERPMEKRYPTEVVRKAKELFEYLPQYTLDFLLETVTGAPQLTIEDFLENLLA